MRLPLLCLVAAAIQLYGAPEGCHPVVGDVLYTGEGGDLRVESHGDAIVDWDTFSIGEQERLYFAQDSPSSAILNRVVGGVRSDLYGSLESNGKVFLVNPMGIFIGPNASIDTASFLASTLDILDQDFLERQELLLSGESEGAIIHLGAIRCWEGDAVLCARKVTTQGKIETPAGSACIGAGGVEWLYRPHAAERLFVRARARAREEPPLAAEGEIAGQGVYLASSNPEGPAIACSAEIRGGGRGERSTLSLMGKRGSLGESTPLPGGLLLLGNGWSLHRRPGSIFPQRGTGGSSGSAQAGKEAPPALQ
jgi:filamentous hemagglutinin family protein